MPDLLSMAAAAKETGYSLRYFRRLLQEKHIPIVAFQRVHGGKKFFIRREDLKRVVHG